MHIELDRYGSEELKRAARFWVGKEAGSYNKDKCIAALTRIMNGDDAARRVLAALSEKERQVLAIFTRYGPTVSGGVLTAEMYARGLAQLPPKDQASEGYYRAYHDWRRNDLIRGLGEKLVLVGNSYDIVLFQFLFSPLSTINTSSRAREGGRARRSLVLERLAASALRLWEPGAAHPRRWRSTCGGLPRYCARWGHGRPSRATRPPRRRARGCKKRWVCAMPKKTHCRRPIRSRCSTNCSTAWA